MLSNVRDLLFVVDNSGSMSEEQENLARSFDTFIHWLTQENVDFHIAITTTDVETNRGELLGPLVARGDEAVALMVAARDRHA